MMHLREYVELQKQRDKEKPPPLSPRKLLVNLLHATQCTLPTCRATPLCRSIKRLWKHIGACQKDQCHRRICVLSRGLLHHYSQCKDEWCTLCRPVRQSMVRLHKKRKVEQSIMPVSRPVCKPPTQVCDAAHQLLRLSNRHGVPIHDTSDSKMKSPAVYKNSGGNYIVSPPSTWVCPFHVQHVINEHKNGRRAKVNYIHTGGYGCHGYTNVQSTNVVLRRVNKLVTDGANVEDALVEVATDLKLFEGCPHAPNKAIVDAQGFLRALVQHSLQHAREGSTTCERCPLAKIVTTRHGGDLCTSRHSCTFVYSDEVFKSVRAFVTMANGWSASLRQGSRGSKEWVGSEYVRDAGMGKMVGKRGVLEKNEQGWT